MDGTGAVRLTERVATAQIWAAVGRHLAAAERARAERRAARSHGEEVAALRREAAAADALVDLLSALAAREALPEDVRRSCLILDAMEARR